MTENFDNKETTNRIVVGDGSSQYASVEALAEGKAEADNYIMKLKSEKQALLAEMEELRKKADIAEQLRQMKGEEMNTENTNTLDVNEEAIRQIALKAVQDNNKSETETKNLVDCKNAVAKMFNTTDADVALKTKANELGCTVEYLEGIAKSSPKAFKSMFGIKEPVSFESLQFLQGSRQVKDTQDVEEQRKNIRSIISSGNYKAIGELYDKAFKDPSILDCLESW